MSTRPNNTSVGKRSVHSLNNRKRSKAAANVGDKWTLCKDFNQTLNLDATDIATGTSARLWQASTGIFWAGRRPHPPYQETTDNQRAGPVGSQASAGVTALWKGGRNGYPSWKRDERIYETRGNQREVQITTETRQGV
jgi:hypothetical protein